MFINGDINKCMERALSCMFQDILFCIRRNSHACPDDALSDQQDWMLICAISRDHIFVSRFFICILLEIADQYFVSDVRYIYFVPHISSNTC